MNTSLRRGEAYKMEKALVSLAREVILAKIGPLECPGWRMDFAFLDRKCSCGAEMICLVEQTTPGGWSSPKHHTYSHHLCLNLSCRKISSRNALCRTTMYNIAVCPACRRRAWDHH